MPKQRPEADVRGRRRRSPLGSVRAGALVAGLACWLVAWAVSNPPGASPDEPAQYLKAVATATGQLQGHPEHASAQGSPSERFLASSSAAFLIPRTLVPDSRWTCEANKPTSARCLHAAPDPAPTTAAEESTYVAFYPPAAYLPYGIAATIGGSPDRALYLGRLAGTVCCAALLAIAVASLRPGLPRAALLAVASPMALFMAASLNPSGLEIAAGIATAASTLRLVGRPAGWRPWALWAVSAVVLAGTRQLGPVAVLFDLAVGIALLGWRGLRETVAASRRSAAIAALAVGAAIAAMAGWDVLGPQAGPPPHQPVGTVLVPGLRVLWAIRKELFGSFGWLDTYPPAWETDAALCLYALLPAAALILGRARQRLVLAGAAAVALAWALAVEVITQMPAGYQLQARYVMPFTAMVLLLAAVAIDGRLAGRLRALPAALGLALAVLGGLAWEANAHRAAVGPVGPRDYLATAAWAPPGGWLAWTLVVAVGSVLAAAAGWAPACERPAPRHAAT